MNAKKRCCAKIETNYNSSLTSRYRGLQLFFYFNTLLDGVQTLSRIAIAYSVKELFLHYDFFVDFGHVAGM